MSVFLQDLIHIWDKAGNKLFSLGVEQLWEVIMLQIDDAGSGSFIGGTCIGIYRPQSNDYYFDIIPVELYNKENFKKKYYLDDVVEIISKGIRNFNIPKSETIEICRGYMFEKLKGWLDDNGYTWYCTQISGRAQEIIEKNFELYTERLGLPRQYIKYTKYPFHFHKLLRWVYADYDKRLKHCKVGWKSWQKIEGIKPELSHGIMQIPYLSCLKCGKSIRKGSKIRILKYTSNMENFVYMHENC